MRDEREEGNKQEENKIIFITMQIIRFASKFIALIQV